MLAGEPLDSAVLMSVAPAAAARPRTDRVPLRVSVAGDVADLWMAVRDMFQRGGEARSFVAALSDNSE